MNIKSVIKRDGTEEPFIPSKINNWSIWASETEKDKVDWSSLVLEAVKDLPEKVKTSDLQYALIKTAVSKKKWAHALTAGRLQTSVFRKELYNNVIPTIRELHSRLVSLGIMVNLNYTEMDYSYLEEVIDHEKDFRLSYHQIKQLVQKYSLKNTVTDEYFESPQFVYMRMAMALAEAETHVVPENKLEYVVKWYRYFSEVKINPPSPNYFNLGTSHNGYASCCLYKAGDDRRSLAIGDHIAYTMTYMSAGIGSYIETRSVGDPVRNGAITHKGKMPYFESMGKATKANMQGGRGGAGTTYFSIYDPEAPAIAVLRNPKTAVAQRNRDLHYAVQYNTFILKKAAANKDVFTFNTFTAPDLQEALFNGDQTVFESIYNKYENDSTFKKNYVSARELLELIGTQFHEVATVYAAHMGEINRHTPHYDTIHSSNLCLEITQPTKAYEYMTDLYATENTHTPFELEHIRGEISTCSLASIVHNNIENDEELEDVAYMSLLMIDICIHKGDYELPHMKYTSHARMNAGIGTVGLAHMMAREGLKYNTPEGLKFIHDISERHSYYVIKASLRLGRELGNAKWMYKTKWPEGWLPIDTYNRNIDTIVPHVLTYDWESLRSEIIENKGIRNSSLIAYMPTESSSKATGLPNGVYPIRDLNLTKTDAENVLDWVAKDNDIHEDRYQLAWELSFDEMAQVYGVIQKFTDQSISADFYEDRRKNPMIGTTKLIKEWASMVKWGVKTRYYTNSYTFDAISLEEVSDDNKAIDFTNSKIVCVGGCDG